MIAVTVILGYRQTESLVDFLIKFSFYYLFCGVFGLWTFSEFFFHKKLHGEVNLDPEAEADPDVLQKLF